MKEISELEARKNEILTLFKKYGTTPSTLPSATNTDLTKAYNELPHVNMDLNLAQQKYLALLLSSIHKSSDTLERLTKNLNRLTAWLLVMTFVLTGLAIGDYVFTYILHLK